MDKRRQVLAVLGLATAVVTTGAAPADRPPALARVQPGQWQIKELGSTGAGRSLCLADPAKVLQIAHGDAACSRTVIDSSATKLTVRYTCAGKGNGQSILTVSTSGAFRLQTQGMAGGAPFDYDYDAKRTGDCTGG
jgi:hypothetical protein